MTKASSISANAKRIRKHRKNQGKEKVRESGRRNTAAYRDRKNSYYQNVKEEINRYRSLIGEPPADFSKKIATKKGTARPTYNPPEEVASKMTDSELALWRDNASKERKKKQQAEADRRKKEEYESLENELSRVKKRHEEVFGFDLEYCKKCSEPIEPISLSDDEMAQQNKVQVEVTHEDWLVMLYILMHLGSD